MKVHPLGDITAYQVFGISLDFDQELLDAMHKTMVRKHHPDKGGDPAVFLKYQIAYEILSDPAQRSAERLRERNRLDSAHSHTTSTINPHPPLNTESTIHTGQPWTDRDQQPPTFLNRAVRRTEGSPFTIYDTKVRGRVFHGAMLALFFAINSWLFIRGGSAPQYNALVLSVGFANVLVTLPWTYMLARFLATRRGAFILLTLFYLFGVFALISTFLYGLVTATAVLIAVKVFTARKEGKHRQVAAS